MSINLQKISDAINAKISSFDGNSSTTELVKIIESINNVNAHGGVITAPSKNALPLADSSNTGTIAFVRSTGYTDSAGTFYFGTGTDWSILTTTSDSADSAAVAAADAPAAQTLRGTQYGYFVGGYPNGSDFGIQQYSFTSDGNATKVGSQAGRKQKAAGFSSATHAYAAGGDQLSVGQTSKVDKFSFATLTDAAYTTDLDVTRSEVASTHTGTIGYTMNGYASSSNSNRIDKYNMTSDTPSTLTATMITTTSAATGCGSTTHGYASGGGGNPAATRIEKFAFASESTNATDVGDLSTSHLKPTGNSSETHGYVSGGNSNNVINKFPFAADGNASDIGDLTVGRYFTASAGANSTTHGYCAGGGWPAHNTIDKFSFSADGNATDVGNLTSGTMWGSTAQN